MKALTLTQPWATLVALGLKRFETRSWPTSYRGTLAIHAAKGMPKYARYALTDNWAVYTALCEHFDLRCPTGQHLIELLPRGVVVARCQVVDCKRIVTREHLHMDAGASSAYRAEGEMFPPLDPELSFGNYDHGRYAWILDAIKPLATPIPAKGALSLWQWPGPENALASSPNTPVEAKAGERTNQAVEEETK